MLFLNCRASRCVVHTRTRCRHVADLLATRTKVGTSLKPAAPIGDLRLNKGVVLGDIDVQVACLKATRVPLMHHLQSKPWRIFLLCRCRRKRVQTCPAACSVERTTARLLPWQIRARYWQRILLPVPYPHNHPSSASFGQLRLPSLFCRFINK
eukprot:COSAG02_NODE_3162_length_7248_cov_147.217793_2_plen_153_part_00